MFAALVEIVALLEQDTNVDWASVDIDSLRDHLLDMRHLMLDTTATNSVLSDYEIQFHIRGTATSTPSVHRMAAAHARFIEESRGWRINTELKQNGAVLTINTEDTAAVERLHALGFYGFMSLDSHHQAHHYRMAVGGSH